MRSARRIALGAAVATLVALSPAAVRATTPEPLANPTSNTAPSAGFVNACYRMGTSKADNDACDKAALVDFNAVRAGEGLGPMRLPEQFDALGVPFQLLAISDVERVDRGLIPVDGLSTSIDALAQSGADNDADPMFPTPFPGDSGGSNWAGAGNSALLDDFYWMYDDGPGSANEDCTAAGQSGCWGHRDDILGNRDGNTYAAPLRMGAAVADNTPSGTSMTEEFISADSSDQVDLTPTWATISASPVLLSGTTVRVSTDTSAQGHATIVVTAPPGGAQVQATVTSGAKAWSVSPGSCALAAAGDTCTLRVTFDPPHSGSADGVLLVGGPVRNQSVALVGRQAPPHVGISVSSSRVAAHHAATITGVVTAGLAGARIAAQLVELERRHGTSWTELAAHRSTARGLVHFRIRPARTATYRLEALSSGGAGEAASALRRIVVTRGTGT